MNENVNKNCGIVRRKVVVHPYLTTDPIQWQGETGKVVEVSSANPDVLTVEFNDGSKGTYLADGLLTMRQKKDI